MHVKKIESLDPLEELKERYMQQTTAPLDGMWLCGFVPMAAHYGFYQEKALVGFCCVNDDGYLLQFFLRPLHQGQSSSIFEMILGRGESPAGAVKGAFVSTAEPQYLSRCLDHFSRFEVNALMYQLNTAPEAHRGPARGSPLPMATVSSTQLQEAVEFGIASVGAPAQWLSGYYANLIERQELFGLWENGRLIATGESRGYDKYQKAFADLGVIVAESERGRGLATQILRHLVSMNEARGLRSICSTEKANIAAQKAIRRAGFIAHNRIIRFDI